MKRMHGPGEDDDEPGTGKGGNGEDPDLWDVGSRTDDRGVPLSGGEEHDYPPVG